MRRYGIFILALVVSAVGINKGWARNKSGTAKSETVLLEAKAFELKGQVEGLEEQKLDFRYQLHWWQTLICLVDDPHKSLVGMEGQMFYSFEWKGAPREQHWFYTQIQGGIEAEGVEGEVSQKLWDAKTPVVITERKTGELVLRQEAWSWASKDKQLEQRSKRRVDYLWLKMKNEGSEKTKGRIVLSVDAKRTLVLAMIRSPARLQNSINSSRLMY